jgi:transcriptional regulator
MPNRPTLTKAERAERNVEIFRLRAKGLSCAAIAHEIGGITQQGCSQIIHAARRAKLGGPPRRPSVSTLRFQERD